MFNLQYIFTGFCDLTTDPAVRWQSDETDTVQQPSRAEVLSVSWTERGALLK
jgi:hypothetical protein